MEIYTDGSSLGNPGPSGCAIVCVKNDKFVFSFIKNFGVSTNGHMELQALLIALECVVGDTVAKPLSQGRRPCTIIYSDSSYVVKGINEWLHGWKRNNWKKADKSPVKFAEVWKEIDVLLIEKSKCCKIEIKWVKAHNGNVWNELVDTLAKKAAGNAVATKRRIADKQFE